MKLTHPEKTVILESTLTCPACGFASTETMPADPAQRQAKRVLWVKN